MTPENLAKLFHNTYERLAPKYGYGGAWPAAAMRWDQVPEKNRPLMIAVADVVLKHMRSDAHALRESLDAVLAMLLLQGDEKASYNCAREAYDILKRIEGPTNCFTILKMDPERAEREGLRDAFDERKVSP